MYVEEGLYDREGKASGFGCVRRREGHEEGVEG